MLSGLLALAAVPAVLGQLTGIPDDNRLVQEGGVLRFPLRVSEGAPAKHSKRQDSVDTTAQELGFFYSIDLTLGTPGQTVTVNFATGSAEFWVNPVCSKSNNPDFCEQFGRFTQSSTFVSTGTTGESTYGTGYADFNYGYDYVRVGC